jgi:4-hydroxybenzoate polyprenyltransferase
LNYLNLVRYKNLIFIGLMQVFIKYGFFNSIGIDVTLNDFQLALLVLATVSIAAAGNIINDIYDVDADIINKPDKLIVGKKVSEKNAYRIFFTLNVLGVFSGFLLSNSIGKPGFAALFIIISALLYLYASMLKGILLVGNILISALIAFSILIVGVFDVLPAIDAANFDGQVVAMKVITHYACFAFFVNLIREIVKDIEDINGDKNGGLNTLPIAIGRSRATTVVFVLGILAVVAVIFYMYLFLYASQLLVTYFLLLVVAPLFYYCVKAYNAEIRKDLSHLSLLLKVIMFFGMCSLPIYYLVLI